MLKVSMAQKLSSKHVSERLSAIARCLETWSTTAGMLNEMSILLGRRDINGKRSAIHIIGSLFSQNRISLIFESERGVLIRWLACARCSNLHVMCAWVDTVFHFDNLLSQEVVEIEVAGILSNQSFRVYQVVGDRICRLSASTLATLDQLLIASYLQKDCAAYVLETLIQDGTPDNVFAWIPGWLRRNMVQLQPILQANPDQQKRLICRLLTHKSESCMWLLNRLVGSTDQTIAIPEWSLGLDNVRLLAQVTPWTGQLLDQFHKQDLPVSQLLEVLAVLFEYYDSHQLRKWSSYHLIMTKLRRHAALDHSGEAHLFKLMAYDLDDIRTAHSFKAKILSIRSSQDFPASRMTACAMWLHAVVRWPDPLELLTDSNMISVFLSADVYQLTLTILRMYKNKSRLPPVLQMIQFFITHRAVSDARETYVYMGKHIEALFPHSEARKLLCQFMHRHPGVSEACTILSAECLWASKCTIQVSKGIHAAD